MSPTPAQRYAKLVEEVRRHDRLYYVEARPEISDAAYDRLYRELQDLEQAHPNLADENSPTQKVGGAPHRGHLRRSAGPGKSPANSLGSLRQPGGDSAENFLQALPAGQ